MIVLSEAAPHEPATSASARDNIEMTKAARLAGCRIYHIPKDFAQCGDAAGALWHVPHQDQPQLAIWSGFIPSRERYEAIYAELAGKRIYLPNTPKEHLTALEFDRFYPLLGDLTPRSATVSSVEDAVEASKEIGFPIFLRGAARSLKAAGWKACVAADVTELRDRVADLLARPYRSRGRVILRQLAPLRFVRTSDEGFPLGREYRVFLYADRVLGFGYYWEGDDPLQQLNAAEQAAMLAVAQEAARRVGTPFLVADVGQTVNGDWIVIEVGDAQFAGAGQTPLVPLWIATRNLEPHWKAHWQDPD